MKKLAFLLIFLFVLCGCTAQENDTPYICEKIYFDKDNMEEIVISAIYTTPGNDTETTGEKVQMDFVGGNIHQAIQILASDTKKYMYKPVKSIAFGSLMDDKDKFLLITELVNTTEMQLKCDIYEDLEKEYFLSTPENDLRAEKISFSEYYRIKTSEVCVEK